MNINTILRRIKKNQKWFGLNVLGLTIAFTCTLMVYSFVTNELNYDRFHSKADRIYRLTENTNTGKSSMIDARIWGGVAPLLKDEFKDIQDYVRLSSFRNAIVTIDENIFFSKKIYGVDSSFFNVFDYELLIGNKKNMFKRPKHVVISKTMAERYFGSTDILNKRIKILHQKSDIAEEFTIEGVIKDFPENSHFKADFLCSYKDSRDNWSYTYLLLPQNVESMQLQDSIQSYWNSRYAKSDYSPIANLQPLTAIHLHSHKSREIEQNGNMQAIYLLISGVLIVFIIALINFANLNSVQYLSEQKSFMVKAVNGATPIILAKEFFKENLILLTLVIGLGFISVNYLSNLFSFKAFLLTAKLNIAILTFTFFIIVSIFAALPFLYRKVKPIASLTKPQNRSSHKVFLVMQLALSVIAITSTLFLQKQINYINTLHPNAKKSDLIVMPKNPMHVTAKFKTLKEQVLKHPEILEVSSVMEEPAGIVTDNFPYILDGKISDDRKTINILSIDSNFFSFFGIKPIAGTINMGTCTTFEWEQKAIQLWQLERNNQEIPSGLREEITPIHAKYIINKMALGHLEIESAEKAIGKKFQFDFMGEMFPEGEIIGVVNDFHYTNMYVKEKPLVMVARKMFCHCFLFRINANNKNAAIAALKTEWEKIHPDVPFKYEFVSDSYQKVYQKEYMQMRVLMLFAIISIILSVMGLFAMVSFSLKIRVKEIGIRRVNGAKIFKIIKMLNKDYLKWTVFAIILACPVAYYAVSRWLESFAYKTPLSWWVFAFAGGITLLIALLTVSWQTFRAARHNPVEALRYE